MDCCGNGSASSKQASPGQTLAEAGLEREQPRSAYRIIKPQLSFCPCDQLIPHLSPDKKIRERFHIEPFQADPVVPPDKSISQACVGWVGRWAALMLIQKCHLAFCPL